MHDTSCVTDAWYLELIDRHTPGPRDDVSPLFANSAAFAGAVSDLAARCEPLHVDVVAAIDALGFVLVRQSLTSCAAA
jgi:hypothetical protein